MANKFDLTDVALTIENEGFDYCFKHKSSFPEIKDKKFHKLRVAYVEAANALEEYVKENSSINFN